MQNMFLNVGQVESQIRCIMLLGVGTNLSQSVSIACQFHPVKQPLDIYHKKAATYQKYNPSIHLRSEHSIKEPPSY